SVSRSWQSTLRGFIEDLTAPTDNAHGFRQDLQLTDVYLDTHLSWKLPRSVVFLAGADYLFGNGTSQGADFDYTVPLNGSSATAVRPPSPLDVHTDDRRNFFGPYASVEWTPISRFRLDAGIRINVTHESQQHDDPANTPSLLTDSRTDARVGGSIGAIF